MPKGPKGEKRKADVIGNRYGSHSRRFDLLTVTSVHPQHQTLPDPVATSEKPASAPSLHVELSPDDPATLKLRSEEEED